MPWHQFARIRWRAAMKIHAQLQKLRLYRLQLELPTASWKALLDTCRLHGISQRSGWELAASELDHQLLRACGEVSQRFQQAQRILRRRMELPALLSVPELWQDLEGLTEEFSEMDVDFRAHEISVVTESIELEGVDLGRFQIVLNWSRLAQHHPYHLEALDPFPAESREDLVHPHLNDSILCEGEGQVAIRHALEQGRLLDFFMLVRQVLKTYNPDSAYLALDQWQGLTCQDCGQLYDEDNLFRCRGCHDLICGECYDSCFGCGGTCCRACQRLCPHCENYFCAACLIGCSACGAPGCESCLAEALCPDCQPIEDHTDDTLEPPLPENCATDTTLHPVCLGETALPP